MNDRSHVGIATPVDLTRSPHARVKPVPVSSVRLEGEFWSDRIERNARVTLPSQWERLEASGVLDNFRRAAGEGDAPHRGFVFVDTDLYKWVEAVSWTLCSGPNLALENLLEQGLSLIERAQQPDGYLNTYFVRERAGARFTNLRDMHELYSAGHLIQAAVAHHRSTGSERLLDVARRFADLLCAVFGPEESGRRPAMDGHQEVEMALVELSRETGDPKYLELARFFLEARGRGLLGLHLQTAGHGLLWGGEFGPEYFQDHAPFRDLQAMAGHAVRALYYCSGMSDLYLEQGDATLLRTLVRLFEAMVGRQAYVTGGVGARHEGEAFGEEFELPNARAYTETCAAIASLMWCHRMLAATGEARYAEAFETTLYNAVLPAWSLDGSHYFYMNPLQDRGGHRRLPWNRCACCPPNLARTLASLGGYLYGAEPDALWVHHYAQGSVRLALAGAPVELVQRTRYPWEGRVELEVKGAGEFALFLRIPSWCSGARLRVAGAPAAVAPVPGAYAELRRSWRRGDRVELELDMPVRMLESHPHLLENAGRVALARGPVLYCVEGADHPGVDLLDLGIDPGEPPEAAWDADRLGGVVSLRGRGELHGPGGAWNGLLYRPLAAGGRRAARPVAVTAVPYFAWANREAGPMQIWLRALPRGRNRPPDGSRTP